MLMRIWTTNDISWSREIAATATWWFVIIRQGKSESIIQRMPPEKVISRLPTGNAKDLKNPLDLQ